MPEKNYLPSIFPNSVGDLVIMSHCAALKTVLDFTTDVKGTTKSTSHLQENPSGRTINFETLNGLLRYVLSTSIQKTMGKYITVYNGQYKYNKER